MYEKLTQFASKRGVFIGPTIPKEKNAILQYLAQAIATNNEYLALVLPTEDERNDHINSLTKQMTSVERLLLNDMESQE